MKYFLLLTILFAFFYLPCSAQTKEVIAQEPPADPPMYFYHPTSLEEERFWIDDAIRILSSNSDAVVGVILEFKNLTTKQVNYRISRILNRLHPSKSVLKDRFCFLPLKTNRDYNKVIIRSKKDVPACQGGSLIKGSTFKPKRINKNK